MAVAQVKVLRPALPALLRTPRLWPVAVLTAWRLAPGGWWRRRPWLPVPDSRYLGFRMETAYGDRGHPIEPDDLLAYLEWCREERCRRRHGWRGYGL